MSRRRNVSSVAVNPFQHLEDDDHKHQRTSYGAVVMASVKKMLFRYKVFFFCLIVLLVLQVVLSLFLPSLSSTTVNLLSMPFAWVRQAFGPSALSVNGSVHEEASKDSEWPCHVEDKDALSALKRASSKECKDEIARLSCINQKKELFPEKLPNNCPNSVNPDTKGTYLGCFEDTFQNRIFEGVVHKLKTDNSANRCISVCTTSGFLFAGVQYGIECFCGNKKPDGDRHVPDGKCDKPCPGEKDEMCGGYLTMNVYRTGVIPFKAGDASLAPEQDIEKPARIAFLLTVNGRAVRQVRRLLKRIYRKKHFYFIHVDSRQEYLFRELLPLEEQFPNIKLTRNRLATIWGGASLLQMLSSCIRELFALPWEWDYVLNLSESDYPLKNIDDLTRFLTKHQTKNFVKTHGRETRQFIQKQGLERTFYECDNHMWRIGHRSLPGGIQIDGGSDWVCLHRAFAKYVVEGDDELITGLRTVFAYTLLPAESFFHTLLRNSEFCSTYINNNLHSTNWKRKLGCKCQHKAVVDWCGCSPDGFTPEDWTKINKTAEGPIFFGRKFEAVINQEILTRIDKWLDGPDAAPIKQESYWQNIYHHEDKSGKVKEEEISLAHLVAKLTLHEQGLLVKDEVIREITSYQVKDELLGILVLFEIQGTEIEAHITVKSLRTSAIINEDRRMHIGVGTDLDPKELVFRNLFRAMGPRSKEIIVQFTLPTGQKFVNGTFAVFDPFGTVAFEKEISKNESEVLDGAVHVTVPKHFSPGQWWVAFIVEGKIEMNVSFFVTPLIPIPGLYQEDDLKSILQYKESDYKLKLQSYDLDFYTKVYQDLTRDQKHPFHLSFTQSDLITPHVVFQETLEPLRRFYTAEQSCVVSNKGRVSFPRLSKCKDTEWSSRSPDPKSIISGVDDLTGKMF